MQQSGATDVRILINLYKIEVFLSKKLIWEFSDKGLNVKGLNKLLKKLQDSDSMTWWMGSGQRRTVPSDASLVFTRYSTNI